MPGFVVTTASISSALVILLPFTEIFVTSCPIYGAAGSLARLCWATGIFKTGSCAMALVCAFCCIASCAVRCCSCSACHFWRSSIVIGRRLPSASLIIGSLTSADRLSPAVTCPSASSLTAVSPVTAWAPLS